MVKILFGVAGEGFGHSSRSELIGRWFLERGHDVMFAASGKSLAYLAPLFPGRVQEVYGLHFVIKDGQIQPISTLVDNIVQYRKGFLTNRRLFSRAVADFVPDLVISDFEPFSAWWAFRHRIPCVFVDNEHLLTLAKLEQVPGRMDHLKARVVTRGYHTRAKAYVIMNFFRAPLKSTRAVFANPVIRKQVMNLKVDTKPHITVYSTDSKPETRQKLISVFSRFPSHPFYIYGFPTEDQDRNCTFKKISTMGFLTDLATGAGVVASAGLSLLSECLYLKKKMLMVPVQGQFEQKVNAVYAQRLGVAHQANQIDADNLRCFLDALEQPFSTDERILWPDNAAYFAILAQTLAGIGFDV